MDEEMASILYTKMFEPEHMELAQVLQDGLKKHFEEATVEWVDCPNLTQEPFGHAAAGLCGDTVFLKIGDKSNLFCQIPQMEMRYEFENILKTIYNNYSNALIIGGGFTLRKSTQQFGNLYMNASFSQVEEDHYAINNLSSIRFRNHLTGKLVNEPINDFDLACYKHGNFFISEGKPGKVLRVYARKPLTSLSFGSKLHQVLSEKYSSLFSSLPSLNCMGLYGTVLTKYEIMSQPVIRSCDDQFETSENINNWIHHDNLCLPERSIVAVSINENTYNNYSLLCGQEKIYGPSEYNSEIFSYDVNSIKSNCTVKVLGYLYPTKTFYYIDAESTLLFEYDS